MSVATVLNALGITSAPPREHSILAAMVAIAASADKPLTSADDREEIQCAQKQWEQAAKIIAGHGDDSARAAWVKQNATMAARMVAGTFDPEKDNFTIEDFQEDFFQRRESGKAAQRQISQSCLPLAEKAAANFAAFANKTAAAIEENDRAGYERYGVKYEPSALLLRIRQCANIATSWISAQKASPYSTASPRSLCPYLEL